MKTLCLIPLVLLLSGCAGTFIDCGAGIDRYHDARNVHYLPNGDLAFDTQFGNHINTNQHCLVENGPAN